MSGDVTERLVAAMRDAWERWEEEGGEPAEGECAPATAAALVPVVEELRREAAAEELEALEREALSDPTRSIQRIAQDRARALRAKS